MSEPTARTAFHFHTCWELPEMLGRRAFDERELLEHLEEVPLDSVYLHLVEARGRKGRRRSDFAAWVDEQLKLPDLAARMGRLNPFQQSLEDIRRRLVTLADEALDRA